MTDEAKKKVQDELKQYIEKECIEYDKLLDEQVILKPKLELIQEELKKKQDYIQALRDTYHMLQWNFSICSGLFDADIIEGI